MLEPFKRTSLKDKILAKAREIKPAEAPKVEKEKPKKTNGKK